MKAAELRMGNLVYNPTLKEIRTIDYLDIRDFFERRLFNDFEPIPITSEWLEKFGFVKKDIVWKDGSVSKDCYQLSWYYVRFEFTDPALIFFCKKSADNENIYIANIEHIHQLQNIWFALRHEELTIKKETAV